MGLSKIVNKGNKIVFVHQLGQDGKPYAENIIIELQPGVPESRNEYWATMDGKIGVVSVSFTKYDQVFSDLQFPEV